MRKSFIRLLGIVAVLTWSAQVFAAGLGGIKVISALGQPLDAEVELVAFTKQERISAQARLASPEAYQGVGLDYPSDIKFIFRIRTRGDGSSYIKVTTTEAVNDPYVSLLVDMVWTPGRLLREYTFLLDPPGYKVEAEEGEVIAVAPEAQGASDESDRTRTDGAASSKGPYKGGTVTVKRGDTLLKISKRTKPVEVSLERMLVALYRANSAQFDGNNMNRIKVGKVLHLPSRAQLSEIKQAEAVKEIRAQAEDWNAYRQKLASSVAPPRKAAPVKQSTQGKITTSVTDKAPATEESAEGVLKLSRGESPGDGVGAGAVGKEKGAQEAGDVQQEQAITSAKSASEAQRRTEVLEKNIEDAKRLAELKAAGAAAVSAPEAAQPVSLMDRILSEPSYLIGLIAAVLGLGGLALLLLRSSDENGDRKASDVWIAPKSDTSLVTPVKPEVQPAKPEKTVEAVQEEGGVDPISEAGLLLNFGREAQAEEVLKEAMQNQPDNHQIHLKLLDMYASRRNTAAFAEIAQQLRDSGDEDAWQQAVEMGRKLEPDNPLYGSSDVEEEPAGVEEQAEAESEEAPPPVEEVLEFTLDDDMPAEPVTEETAENAEESEPRFQTAGDMLSDISLDLGETDAPENAAQANTDEHWQEVATKLDLARAYHEMGDTDGARAILEEVMHEGDDGQREAAQSLLDRIG